MNARIATLQAELAQAHAIFNAAELDSNEYHIAWEHIVGIEEQLDTMYAAVDEARMAEWHELNDE